jgi:hypothetical protein
VENNGLSRIAEPVNISELFYLSDMETGELSYLDKRDFEGYHVQPCPENTVMVGSGK